MVRAETQQIAERLGEPTSAPRRIAALAEAFGLAWASFTLYENPRAVPAFDRAVETLGGCPHFPFQMEVGVDGFLDRGEVVISRRDATQRLPQRVFALGVAAVELTSPPSQDDLIKFLGLLAMNATAADPNALLKRAGVHTIRLLHRAIHDADAGGETADEAWYLSYNGTPEPFVHQLIDEAGGDDEAAGRMFVEEYERVYDLIDAADTWGREEVVHAFIDAFSYLPRRGQAAALAQTLSRPERPGSTEFLDQFGDTELIELSQMFGDAGHPLLVEYVRVAAANGVRRGPGLSQLGRGRRVESVGTAVTGMIASVLASPDERGAPGGQAAITRLRSAAPDGTGHDAATLNLVRGLFDLAGDHDAIARTAVFWASQVDQALAAGDLRSADRWLTAVAGLDLEPDALRALLDQLSESLGTDALDRLTTLLAEQDTSGHGAAAKKLAPLVAGSRLMDALGFEQQIGRRKYLLKALTTIARARPPTLFPYLDDPRWYVVRNVVLLLGNTGSSAVSEQIRGALSHPEPRVRSEALRSLYRIEGPSSAGALLDALGDDEDLVSNEAAELLRRIPDPGIDHRLEELVEAGRDHNCRIRAVGALGRRSTPHAQEVLGRMARLRFSWRANTRAIRRAARRALEADRD